MNQYTQLKERQQEEFNQLPLAFAFGIKQFNEMMEKWGLHPERDIKKICSIGYGGYIQKKDVAKLREVRARHAQELKDAIAADTTGEGFIYEMFLAEMQNHEYGYTMDTEDTLAVLGYTAQQVVDDPRLNRGISKAHETIVGRD